MPLRDIRATLLFVSVLAATSISQARPPSTITVGSLSLTLCNTDYTGYCGSIRRPLDPSGAVRGSIDIGFEFYPRRNTALPRLGTLLPQEGGPGYSSTGSRDFYLGLFDALRDRRDVLIIDKRGTGLSAAIDCPAMQAGSASLAAIGACASQLGASSWLYGTRFATADIVAVLDALGLPEVDFYGDSYGTFVGQVLAGLYPQRLRSIVLDSAYPVRAPDAWFPTDWATAWSGIDLSCSRSPSCRSLSGRASQRLQQLAILLRTRPLKGTAPDAFGLLQQVTLDAPGLMRIIDNAGDGGSIYRELDAAARAWMEQGDARPILRLSAEQDTFSQDDPEAFSYGLYQAVICSDYPLLYDLRQPGSIRSRQYAQALADARAHRSGLFAPFSVDEALVSQMYITPLDSCLPWPAPPPNQAQGQPLPPSIRFPAVPTLVLSGDLDSVTSPQDAAQVTRQFPDAVHVVVPNLTHVVADADEIGCTLGLVQHFVDKLTPGDTACIQRVRAVRTVPRFARSYRDLAPLSRDVGDATSANQRRMAAAGLEAVGDALARYWPSLDSAGTGLRGGQFQYSSTNAGLAFKLTRYQFTDDVAASGRIAWNFNTSVITANVELWNGGRSVGTLNIRWTDSAPDAIATVTGTLGGSLLKAHRIAP